MCHSIYSEVFIKVERLKDTMKMLLCTEISFISVKATTIYTSFEGMMCASLAFFFFAENFFEF